MANSSAVAGWDRRRFLSGMACGAVAFCGAWVVRLAIADDRPAWQMQLSASSIAFSKLPIEEACQRIAKLGFEAIDIWSAHAGCPHLDDVQKRLGGAGLEGTVGQASLEARCILRLPRRIPSVC